MQDARNLAWKLSAVLRGEAAPGLLDSYETERLPVALSNRDFSVGNAVKLKAAEDVFGFSKEGHDAWISKAVTPSAAFTPTPEPFDIGVEGGGGGGGGGAKKRRATLADAIASTYDPETTLRQALAFVYNDGALINDGVPRIEGWDKDYKNNSRPGGRLAHFWLTQNGRRLSTIDFAGANYFLFAGETATALVKAAELAARNFDLPLRIVQIGQNGVADPSGGWSACLGLDPSQALLVRPDGHVAWRSKAGVGHEATDFNEIFQILTGKAPRTAGIADAA